MSCIFQMIRAKNIFSMLNITAWVLIGLNRFFRQDWNWKSKWRRKTYRPMWCDAEIIVCGVEAQLGIGYTSVRHWDNKAFVTAASLLCTLGMTILAFGYASFRGVLNELVWCCSGLCSITTTSGSLCCIVSGGATCCDDSCKLAVDTSQSFTDNSPSWKKEKNL